jgi:aspartyl-tRNA(Asn)/glutamyl-tRNA(Gln) amidotransferase subunit B
MKKYQPVIGLEIHAQLKTKSKMFCSCINNPEGEPNKHTCPVCLGHPGILPTINRRAVRMVLKTGRALGARALTHSKFDRKNYNYPDLPKGYQISQYDQPLTRGGELNKIRVRRVHLEEDTGKLLHEEGKTLIDFNRAGTPLMELVTEPDIKTATEAKKFCQDLQNIFRYLEVSEANMEKGEMRCEVNISLKGKGPKVEIKNLNSFRAVERSILYEIKRQSKTDKIIQETRGWDESQGVTVSQRAKEEAQDYRYFPEPDLPEMEVSDWKVSLPELPEVKAKRFLKEYKIPKDDIDILVKDKSLADYFEGVVSELSDKKLIKSVVNYVLKAKENYKKITGENLAELVEMIEKGDVSSSAADVVLREMQKTGGDPSNILKDKDLGQVSSPQELGKVVALVIKNNKKAVLDFEKGNENSIKFLVGAVMAETKGKANPEVAERILRESLS